MTEQDTSNDTISIYRAGVSWLVGLSAAAVGGAFVNFDKVSSAALAIRLIFVGAAVAFGLAVCFGIQYYFWLNFVSNRTEYKGEVDRLLESSATKEDAKAKLRTDRNGAQKEIEGAWKEIGKFHNRTQRTFEGGMVLAGILLLAASIAGVPSPKAAGDSKPSPAASVTTPYEVVQSAVHQTSHGREAHTFLINKNTGELWQMICHTSDEVEFHRIHRTDFDGKPEDILTGPPKPNRP